MDECLILLDSYDTFLGGSRFSARQKGIVKSNFDQSDPLDYFWHINFGSLLQEVADGHKIIEAVLAGPAPLPKDSLWELAKTQGFTVKTYGRGFSGQERIDTSLVVHGAREIIKHPRSAILKILSGNKGFLPLIELAYEEKWETELWGFSSSISSELNQAVSRLKLLDKVFDKIGRYE
jgi:uncharacterized LabA/DUF88 family protein